MPPTPQFDSKEDKSGDESIDDKLDSPLAAAADLVAGELDADRSINLFGLAGTLGLSFGSTGLRVITGFGVPLRIADGGPMTYGLLRVSFTRGPLEAVGGVPPAAAPFTLSDFPITLNFFGCS